MMETIAKGSQKYFARVKLTTSEFYSSADEILDQPTNNFDTPNTSN